MSTKKLLFFALAVAMSVTVLAGCSLFPSEEELVTPPLRTQSKAATYQTYTVGRGNVVNELKNQTATVVNPVAVDVFFTRAGFIFKQFSVSSGDNVTAGQEIAKADTTAIDYEIKECQFKLRTLEIELAKLQNEGGSSYDIQKVQLDIDYNNNKLNSLNESLSNAVIYAPVSGMITWLESTIKGGDAIEPNKSIARISDIGQLYIDLRVDQSVTSQFKIGMPATIRQNNVEYPGEVIATPETMPEGSGNERRVKIAFTQMPAGGSVANTGVSVSIVFDRRDNVIVVPVNMVAIDNATKAASVQVLEGETKVSRVITVGLKSSQYYEVTNGLNEGEKLVLTN